MCSSSVLFLELLDKLGFIQVSNWISNGVFIFKLPQTCLNASNESVGNSFVLPICRVSVSCSSITEAKSMIISKKLEDQRGI